MPPSHAPTCRNCQYDLTGLPVEDVCPECGTPIWTPDNVIERPKLREEPSGQALAWGVTSLLLFWMCLGPLAGFVAIVAVVHAQRTSVLIQRDYLPPSARLSARIGATFAWITIAFSLLYIVLRLAGIEPPIPVLD